MKYIIMALLLSSSLIISQEVNLSEFDKRLSQLSHQVDSKKKDEEREIKYLDACLVEAHASSYDKSGFDPEKYVENIIRIQIVIGRKLTNQEIYDYFCDDI